MSIQPFFDTSSASPIGVVPLSSAVPSPKRRLHLYPVVETVAQMDCVMTLTLIPEIDGEEPEDHALAGVNLFGPMMDDVDADAMPTENVLRSARRSRLEQSRVVALRRRAIRSRMGRARSAWPRMAGQPDSDLSDMRNHIYCDATECARNERPSVPLRLATHAIGLSLIATALPVGAAMMTYNILKGEDMKVTARLTTLTGLALAVIAGNPGLSQIFGA